VVEPLPVLLPLELPDPMPPLEPVLGEVGDFGSVLGEVLVLPLVLPVPAPELDLLKWASHSAREICPSLLVSTDEKVGAVVLVLPLPDRPPLELLDEPPVVPPAAAPPLDDVPDEPLELEPDAAGEDEDLSLPVVLDDELWAAATPDSANSAAAVATLTNLSFNIG
jgi:hypothetical protein